ncbi:MAG: leucine-rich repeat protein [Verrucomicrobiae bacterium]|nr:leucine-rich repeat protein [Verrucomicrobiae bacterium]
MRKTPSKYTYGFAALLHSGFLNSLDAEQFQDLVYSIVGESVVILDYVGPTTDGLIIPESLDGKPVVEIGPNAFESSTITTLSLPEGLKVISASAFQFAHIEQMVIPASVTYIDPTAFKNSSFGITTVAEGNLNYAMVDGILYDKDITILITYPGPKSSSFELPATLVSLNMAELSQLSNLRTLQIPASLAEIEGLSNYFGRSLETIEVDSDNSFFSSLDGVLYDKQQTQLILWPKRKSLVNYTFPSTLSAIGDTAFMEVEGIGDIILPDSIKSLGMAVFKNCRGLTRISLPSDILSIEEEAFHGCRDLVDIQFGSKLRSIGPYAFSGCPALKTLVLPEGLEIIEDYGLSGLYVSGTLSLPGSVKFLGKGAFWSSLMEQVFIPASVEEIGLHPFGVCTKLKGITVDPQNPTYSSDSTGVLFDKQRTRLIAFPGDNRIGYYKIPDTVERIEAYAMRGNFMHVIDIPSNLKFIERSGMEQSYNLKKLVVPANISSIKIDSFRASRALEEVVFLGAISDIQRHAFLDCEGLVRVEFRGGVVNIGEGAFQRCLSLSDIHFPEGLTEIGLRAFSSCRFAGIVFPASLAKLGSYAFENCTYLKEIHFLGGITEISDFCFTNCWRLILLKFPDTLEVIQEGAFQDCGNIEEIIFPGRLSSIEARAFEDCRDLKRLYFTGDAPLVGNDAFYQVLGTVYIFEDLEGFLLPAWNGFPVVILGPRTKKSDWLISNNISPDFELNGDSFVRGVAIFPFYAFNQNIDQPFQPPEIQVFPGSASYTYFSGREDVTYLVEMSFDLKYWTRFGVLLDAPPREDYSRVYLRYGRDRNFIRFRVFPKTN